MNAAKSTYRVLIVDDNEGIHDDFRTLLQPSRHHDELDSLAEELFGDDDDAPAPSPRPDHELPHYHFDSAFQGVAALENVENAVANGESYAMAFVDIRMPPGLDGIETILKIWAVDPNIHVVLCSAYSDYSWEEIVQRLGISDKLLMLRKPFDPTSVKQLTLATTSRWAHDRVIRERIVQLEAELHECHQQLGEERSH